MTILDQPGSDNPKMYDLSFMYTKRCDLSCPFCMYESNPEVTETLNLDTLTIWLESVDMNRIASFGVYGGEVGVDLKGFGACLDLVKHLNKPHFVITNGTWSTDGRRSIEFLQFCKDYKCFMIVSGTPWHRRFQDRDFLELIKKEYPDFVRLKPKEENFHAMGALEGKMKFSCSHKCISWDRALRIAVQSDGTIIFQNCDGVYPLVGTIEEPFELIDKRVQSCREYGFKPVCSHF